MLLHLVYACHLQPVREKSGDAGNLEDLFRVPPRPESAWLRMADNLLVCMEHANSTGDTMKDSRDTKLGPIAADIENLHQELQRIFDRGSGGDGSDKGQSDQQSAAASLVIRGK